MDLRRKRKDEEEQKKQKRKEGRPGTGCCGAGQRCSTVGRRFSFLFPVFFGWGGGGAIAITGVGEGSARVWPSPICGPVTATAKYPSRSALFIAPRRPPSRRNYRAVLQWKLEIHRPSWASENSTHREQPDEESIVIVLQGTSRDGPLSSGPQFR